jgi:hypothetical protein
MASSPSTSLGFTRVREYVSTDYEFVWLPPDEKFTKENDTQFNRKIHAHDRSESLQVPFDQDSRKGRKFNAG